MTLSHFIPFYDAHRDELVYAWGRLTRSECAYHRRLYLFTLFADRRQR